MGMGMKPDTFSDADLEFALKSIDPTAQWESTDDAPIAPSPQTGQGWANMQPVAAPVADAGAPPAVWLGHMHGSGKSAEALLIMGLTLQYRLDAPHIVRLVVDEGGASLHRLDDDGLASCLVWLRKGAFSEPSNDATPVQELEARGPQGACFLAHGPRGTLVIRVRENRFRTWRLVTQTASSSWLAREIPPLEHEAPPELPALDTLLEGLSSADWLRATYEQGCGAPTLFSRAVPLGLVARLWSPVDAHARATLHTWLKTGRGTASRRVGDWLSTSAFATRRERLARAALDAADRLSDRLETLPARAETLELDELSQVVGLARLERDDLASVHAVLYLLGGRSAVADLDDALDVTDRCAATQRSMIDHAAAHASREEREPRFDAVADEEPDAWWAAR
jgi:hypothetical protein